MDLQEKQMLENLFDALDRLFDKESSVIDLHALLFATSNYSSSTILNLELTQYCSQLSVLIKSGADSETMREKALSITNDLRHKLNELLPI